MYDCSNEACVLRQMAADMLNRLFSDAEAAALQNSESGSVVFRPGSPQKTARLCAHTSQQALTWKQRHIRRKKHHPGWKSPDRSENRLLRAKLFSSPARTQKKIRRAKCSRSKADLIDQFVSSSVSTLHLTAIIDSLKSCTKKMSFPAASAGEAESVP